MPSWSAPRPRWSADPALACPRPFLRLEGSLWGWLLLPLSLGGTIAILALIPRRGIAVDELPATVPVAVALLVLDGADAARRRVWRTPVPPHRATPEVTRAPEP